MGGKRRAQPSGDAQGKAGASGDGAAAQGQTSRKRQTLGLGEQGAAGSAGFESSGQEEPGSILAPVTMCFSMRCDDPSALVGRKAALEAAVEAALRNVVSRFGGRDLRVEWTRVGPSEDTLQRVLPLLLDHLGPEGGAKCILVCKSWRRELEARGFCSKTVQLCSTLAEGGDVERLGQNAQRQLDPNTDDFKRAMCLDVIAFLQRSREREGGLPEWLQAASQEPDVSFLSRGAASTAQALGMPLVQWVGKPQEVFQRGPRFYGSCDPHFVCPVAFSPNGKLVVTGSTDKLVKIWNAATGAEVLLRPLGPYFV